MERARGRRWLLTDGGGRASRCRVRTRSPSTSPAWLGGSRHASVAASRAIAVVNAWAGGVPYPMTRAGAPSGSRGPKLRRPCSASPRWAARAGRTRRQRANPRLGLIHDDHRRHRPARLRRARRHLRQGDGAPRPRRHEGTGPGGVRPPAARAVRIRASQLNGCAYCIDMHTKDARAVGETEQRIYALPAWRETPFFTGRERAALAFTEAVTLMAGDHVPDAAYDAVAGEFSPDEGAALVGLIVVINAWNAIGVSTRTWVPGSYQPLRRPVRWLRDHRTPRPGSTACR